jgi:hypothetical protein
MQIIQETRTIIKAEDGKVLRKKTTGRVVGDTVHLGYDYYEAGILLKEPHLAKPDDYEEVDLIVELDEDGNEIQVTPPDNTLKRLQMVSKILSEEMSNINSYDISDEEKLTIKNLFPRLNEDIKEGDELEEGIVFLFKGKLYRTLVAHKLMPHYFPSNDTKHLYEEVV